MIKHMLAVVMVLTSVLGCAPKAQPETSLFVCITPFGPLQIDSSDPLVEVHPRFINYKREVAPFRIYKDLCVEFYK